MNNSRAPESLFEKRNLDVYEKEWTRKFRNGLEGASIAMGVRPPELVFNDIPGIAAFAFLGPRKKPSVAVTHEVLRVPLSVEEVDALMAEQLSHVIIGDLLKARNSESLLWVAFCPVVGVSFSAMVLSLEAQVSILPFLLILFINGISFGVTAFLARMLKQIRFHNELLTDSIASKITGNPAALKNALIKLENAKLLGSMVYSEYSYSKTARLQEGQGKIRIIDEELVVNCKAVYSIDDRVKNLEAIERGHWKAFEWK